MNSVSQAVMMWQIEGAVAIGILVTVYLCYLAAKVWKAPDSISLMLILSIGLAAVTILFFYIQGQLHFFRTPYALLFLLLYCWCALGTFFIAYRQTQAAKLFIGLLSQAGIVYGLYLWV